MFYNNFWISYDLKGRFPAHYKQTILFAFCGANQLNNFYTIMAEVAEVKPCSSPGCVHPGTSACSACKTSFYCGPICQTADWTHHKEECDGHLRKVGKINLEKATQFNREQNWSQALRYGEIAATKLKQLKDRRLETVQAIDKALGCKFNS